MKNVSKQIIGGLSNVILFCAVWMGAVLVSFILFSGETSLILKIGTIVLLVVAFVFGYLDKRKELNTEKVEKE